MKLPMNWIIALGLAVPVGKHWAEEPKPPVNPPAPANAADKKVKVNLVGIDLATLARQAEKVTRKSFLFDENQLRTKKATLSSDTPITPDEFYRVFQAICQLNGFTIVAVEGAGLELEKIVPLQTAFKEPGKQTVLVSGESVPNGDSPVTYLLKLKFATPTKALAVITPSLSPTGSASQIPNTDLLMVNDLASSIRRIEKLVTVIDVAGESVSSVSVPIRNIGVEKAYAQLTEYLQTISKAQTGESGRSKVALLKDDRLGVLHLIGPDGEVKQAREFILAADLDLPAERRTIQYYKLKNVPVKDIVDYVGRLLDVAMAAKQPELASKQAGTNPAQGAVASPFPAAVTTPGAGPTTISVRSGGSTKGVAEIIPVPGLNTLVVSGDENVQKEVAAILQNLDQRKSQVLIEVAIVQVTGDGTLDLGVEFLTLNNAREGQKSDGGTGFGIGKQDDNRARGFVTDTTLTALSGGAYRYVKADQFQVLVQALATKSNVSIVSQPVLLVNDNEQASFTTKVSQPTTTTSQGTATTNTSFNGFADATTALKLTPHISPDGYLNLEIAQTFEEFQGTAPGPGIPPPKVSNDTTTKVTVPDRQTIVIGGFTRDSASDQKTGVPGLMNIPGLGNLFSRTTKQKNQSRLYLFVRPKILGEPGFQDLRKESEQKKDDVEEITKKSRIKNQIEVKMGRSKGQEPLPPLPELQPEKSR